MNTQRPYFDSKYKKILMAGMALLLAMLACSLPGTESAGDSGVVVATATPTIPDFATAVPQEDGAAETQAYETQMSLEATQAATTQLAQTASLSGSACLPGTWTVSKEAIQSYIGSTLMGNGASSTVGVLEGSGSLQITDTQMFAAAQNVNVQLTSVGIDYTASGSGTASANYTANESVITLTGIVYSGEATLVEPLRTSALDLTGVLKFVQSLGFATGFSTLPLESNLPYTCTSNVLTVRINPHATVNLVRIVP